MLDLANQSALQKAYLFQEKARKIKKMLMCKMRYNKTFNECDLANIERYGITLEVERDLLCQRINISSFCPKF